MNHADVLWSLHLSPSAQTDLGRTVEEHTSRQRERKARSEGREERANTVVNTQLPTTAAAARGRCSADFDAGCSEHNLPRQFRLVLQCAAAWDDPCVLLHGTLYACCCMDGVLTCLSGRPGPWVVMVTDDEAGSTSTCRPPARPASSAQDSNP